MSPLKVYLSSTLKDLERERKAVIDALMGNAIKVSYTANEQPLVKSCLDDIAQCELYIGILGWRYGHVPEDAALNRNSLSITHLEFEEAGRLGMPRLMFLRSVAATVSPAMTDAFSGEHSKECIESLRAAAGKAGRTAEFITSDDLKVAVLQAVNDFEKRRAADKSSASRPAQSPSPPPIDPATERAFATLRESLGAGSAEGALDRQPLEAILRHSPTSFEQYRLARIAEWSQPRYALDRRFTKLTLLIDQGRDTEGERWQPRPEPFDDLSAVLAETQDHPALVVLGPPGCGKSTLLRRLELDCARRDYAAPDNTGVVTFYVPLSRYRNAQTGEHPPAPADWLASEWKARARWLPALDTLLAQGCVFLLLDAINEMPHTSGTDYEARIAQWQAFVATLPPGNRVVFSCRSLDYSGGLSTKERPVPHVRIEAMSDEQVEAFLTAYAPDRASALWKQLAGTAQLDLFRTPYYLRMLLTQASLDGGIPAGRAALFTGFIRQTLALEIDSGNPRFAPGPLLDARDRDRAGRGQWRDAYDLPARGSLFNALSALAFGMQEQREGSEAAEVRIGVDAALDLLDEPNAEQKLKAAADLHLLDDAGLEVFFVHQLLQEYFAARFIAAQPPERVDELAARAASEWRASVIQPGLADLIGTLASSEPIPDAPSTGWEETFVLAAAMSSARDRLIDALARTNLPLAGRCAAQPDVQCSDGLLKELRAALIERSRHPEADLRARIAAGRALGDLGDPRFERRRGPVGAYLMPPLVEIPAGRYAIGSDEGDDDERPVHKVELEKFLLGRFPVTNAEYRCFIEAGGYEDEKWWDTEAARRWRRG
ncbi:MAG: DUF4062 domain-containing protein, partial [Burkholderiales bacterium]